MPRLREVSRDEAHPAAKAIYKALFGDRDPVAEPGTATGTPGNWWTVFAGVPDCFDHAVAGFAFYRSKARKLDPKLRELGQIRAGYARQSQFVFSQHCKSCRSVGLSEEKIAAIPGWASSDAFSPEERAVLAYTDALVLEGGRVQDETFRRLQTFLSDEAILELTYITCTYEMHATICRALRLEYDDVAERIRELAAPGADQSIDVMGTIRGTRSD